MPKMNRFYLVFQPFASLRLFELVLRLTLTENYQKIQLSKFTAKMSLKSTTEKNKLFSRLCMLKL